MKAHDDITTAKNPDLRASLIAIQRASVLARKTAIQTDTSIVIIRNGQLEYISAQQLRDDSAEERER